MQADNRAGAWDASYDRLENHLFYPTEEVVRFMARYVRRRVAPHEYVNVARLEQLQGDQPRLLDLGCGIGRHIVFAHQLGFDSYGLDLSTAAIDKARAWLREFSDGLAANAVVGDARALPWPDRHFSVVVSHGVLDSMPFAFARDAAAEAHRVLIDGGYFYCDLIAPESPAAHEAEVDVADPFEAGTVQSYFTDERLRTLFDQLFEIVEQTLITTKSFPDGATACRWHLVMRRSANA